MAASVEYTEEQLNYYRICYVTTDILTEGLRTIFKQEWDNRYKSTLGEWKDEPRNGLDFWNGESPRNKKRNGHLLATMVKGDRAEWDCTMLFYAILYSDCIHGLNPTVESNVDDLRIFRNEDFAHLPKGHLSETEFIKAINRVQAAFKALGLSSFQLKLQEVRYQTSFPTEELKGVLKKVDSLNQEVQEKEKELQQKGKELQEKEDQRQILEEQLKSSVAPFCVLPPKPSHAVATRECEVAQITQQLKELKSANENSLSYLYISGNPGSGKSQLAGLVAKRFIEGMAENPSATSFVMTLNAENSKTLLESYVSFARHLKCPEYSVTNTVNSTDLDTDEKIFHLNTLISTKIEFYTSWLLVVDNVTNLTSVSGYFPDPGNEQWAAGQMLITTQDTASIPLTSSFIQHISVSKGMNPHDASCLLAMLSGVSNNEMENEVAEVLDYQPLALASAASYVRQVRQSKLTSDFGWNEYLAKLYVGQRITTESILAETNPSYRKSMTAAITLAAEKAMTSDRVIYHAFNFLSMCAPQPLHLEIVLNYFLKVDKEFQDKEMTTMRIQRCSLLLFEEEESTVFIRVHQIVHDVINIIMKDYPDNELLEIVNGVITSFSQFIKDNKVSEQSTNLDSLMNRKHIVPHLVTLIIKIEHLFANANISQVFHDEMTTNQYFAHKLQKLGQICEKYCEFETAKDYYDRALTIQLKKLGSEHVYVANAYNNLGIVHRKLGHLQQAKDYYDRALVIWLDKLGPDHVDVVTAYNNLGNVHSDLGDLEQGKDYYDRTLAIQQKKFGSDHVDVARTYNNLGIVHRNLGDLEQAKTCYERSLAIRMKKLGREHVDVASTYNNLGNVHGDLGDLEQAKAYYDRALAVRLKKLGTSHVDVATAYNNLGNVHRGLSDFEQARDYYDHALAIWLKKFGSEHVDVGTAYNNLGNVHRDLGDLEQAKDYFDRALTIRIKKLGSKHVDVASTYNNLGIIHRDLSDLEKAKDYFDRALAIRLEKLGSEHVDVARSYNHLADVHRNLQGYGYLEQTKDYYDRALTIYLKKLGPQHPHAKVVRRDLARLQRKEEIVEPSPTACQEGHEQVHGEIHTMY